MAVAYVPEGIGSSNAFGHVACSLTFIAMELSIAAAYATSISLKGKLDTRISARRNGMAAKKETALPIEGAVTAPSAIYYLVDGLTVHETEVIDI